MRMWMVEPHFMCRQHLLGEHGELHKFRPSFEKQHDMSKRIRLGQIEPVSMKDRHDALMAEMLRRGMNHRSPYELPDLSYINPILLRQRVNVSKAFIDLVKRCPACYARWMQEVRQQA